MSTKGALTIVSKEVTAHAAVVIIEADSQEQLTSVAAKNLAIQTATAGGLQRAGLSNTPAPYPVGPDGESDEDLRLGRKPLTAYRCEFKLAGGL